MSNKLKVLVSGGQGRFGNILKKNGKKYNYIFPDKKKLNILEEKSIKTCIKKFKPKYFLHLAGLSRPMEVHSKNINKSISLNIIGTANVVKICSQHKIKLIYFSTNYVYPKNKGIYKETDPVLPINNYAWSKLGGESSVQMYNNSLIIRACMTEYPFIHKNAFSNMYTNFIYHKDFVVILEKILNNKGVLNVGGPGKSVYKFAVKDNPKIKKIKISKLKTNSLPLNSLMNLRKLNKLIKKR
tara:strand:- start:4721 stop:5443 length:723 start_codon:yes stop_codon:yes gene_type:complete